MAWNNGLERKKFEAEQAKLAAEYRAAGMSEEQIQQMYEFDLEVFNSNRRFAEHTQQFPESPFEDGDEGQSPLYERFPEVLTVTMDLPTGNSRYAWIDDLDDPALVDFVKALSERDLELIFLLAFDDNTHQEAAAYLALRNIEREERLNKAKKRELQKTTLDTKTEWRNTNEKQIHFF